MKFLLVKLSLLVAVLSYCQDTTIVQTLTFDSTSRAYMFNFPNGSLSYRKVIMQYSMRCKGGLVSTSSNTNLGCGEWDYSCNTFITDSSKTDSIRSIHPNYLISGFSGSTFNYTSQPTYTYFQSVQQDVNYTTVNSETSGIIGTGTNTTSSTFDLSNKKGKSQYLVLASELLSSGIVAGNLTGLKLDISSLGDELKNLRIKIKSTADTQIDPTSPHTDGFTDVYYLNTNFTTVGWHQFNFYNNFIWDGVSNIIIEFSYDSNGTNSPQIQSETIPNFGISTIQSDYSLEFNGINSIDINGSFPSISDEITISFWIKGDSDLPVNTSLFEGVDINNERQVNLHMPWSNGSIYWDCGNDGSGYDRINQAATAQEYKENWQHWAVTKNANTGTMKIYLNGALWLSGNSKTKLIDIQQLVIGTNKNNSYNYLGNIDEFRIWDKELTVTEINDYRFKSITPAHPSYLNLVAYYKYNEGNGAILTDETGNHNGVINNSPIWRERSGENLKMDFIALTERPNFIILQGDYVINTTSITILDSLINSQNLIEQFNVTGTDLISVNTFYAYESGNMNIYDDNGTIVGSVVVPAENTISISDLIYYKKYPSKIELMSFVTPYGIGLDLGINGKSWDFDVTDYLPVLKDNKYLSVEFGNYQEELDIKFLFISGTPTRDVIDIQNIWRAGQSATYSEIINDSRFEPRDINLPSSANMFKIKTTITGHGQEGEFIPRIHNYNINGGPTELTWQVWKQCSENPVFPQGGTWVYDRAGWCPGMASDMKEYEIDPTLISGNTINIDYGLNTASGDSRYIVSPLLVSYGNPNFSVDAAVIEIIKPGLKDEFSRVNPSCTNPIITIQNTGATDLTSLKIDYKVSGGTTETFNWTGNLSFLKTEEIELPISGNPFWSGDDTDVLIVTISNPNGLTDENPDNNELKSAFEFPDWYPQNFVIWLKTNSNSHENSYVIKDYTGNIVFTKDNLTDNTTYKDTLDLPGGCYTLELTDTGNDGLSWWANSSQGSGYMRLRSKSTSQIYKFFEADFGSKLTYGFTIGAPVTVPEKELNKVDVSLYPNPANQEFNFNITNLNTDKVTIKMTDIYGKTVVLKTFNTSYNMDYSNSIDVSELSNGIYFFEVIVGNYKEVKQIVITH